MVASLSLSYKSFRTSSFVLLVLALGGVADTATRQCAGGTCPVAFAQLKSSLQVHAKKAASPADGDDQSCAVDFIIGIDASLSIKGEWATQVGFAKKLASELLEANSENRVALYWFNCVAEEVSSFSQNAADIQSALDDLTYNNIKDGCTNHPTGFMLATEIFSSDGRKDAKKLHVLITDGVPYKAESSCKGLGKGSDLPDACKSAPHKKACRCAITMANKNRHYTTWTIGVSNGNGHQGDALPALASSPDKFKEITFQDLKDNLDAVVAPLTQSVAGNACSCGPLDIVVGIDASLSIKTEWGTQVGFAKKLVSGFLDANSENRVAAYWFNCKAREVSPFSQSSSNVQSALDNLKYAQIKDGCTDHPSGFKFASDAFEKGREGVEKVHVLITDGVPYKATKACKSLQIGSRAAEVCATGPHIESCECAITIAEENRHFTTWTVGVTNGMGHEGHALRALASSESMYLEATFEGLRNNADELVATLASGLCQR